MHGLLPALGPLAGRFAKTLVERPELANATLHDAIDAVDHLETPLPPREIRGGAGARVRPPARHAFQRGGPRSGAQRFCRTDAFRSAHHAGQRSSRGGDQAAARRPVAADRRRTRAVALGRALAGKSVRHGARLRLRALAQTFTDDILRRFDLRAEAANLSQTGHHFDGDTRIVVPNAIWDLCTPSRSPCSASTSLPASDLSGLHAHHVKLAPLAAHIVEVVTEQAFEHGFFHATLDARRVRVSIEPDSLGRLVLAEFSIMSSLSTGEREFFVHGATALFEQDYGRLAELHRDAGHVPHDTRAELLEAELRTRAEAHFAAAPEDRSAGSLFHHLLHAVHPFDGTVSSRLATAQRSFQQAEMLARALHPGVDTEYRARCARGYCAARRRSSRLVQAHFTRTAASRAHAAARCRNWPCAICSIEHRSRALAGAERSTACRDRPRISAHARAVVGVLCAAASSGRGHGVVDVVMSCALMC